MGRWRGRLSWFALGRVSAPGREGAALGLSSALVGTQRTVAVTAKAGEEEDAGSEPSLNVISSLD